MNQSQYQRAVQIRNTINNLQKHLENQAISSAVTVHFKASSGYTEETLDEFLLVPPNQLKEIYISRIHNRIKQLEQEFLNL